MPCNHVRSVLALLGRLRNRKVERMRSSHVTSVHDHELARLSTSPFMIRTADQLAVSCDRAGLEADRVQDSIQSKVFLTEVIVARWSSDAESFVVLLRDLGVSKKVHCTCKSSPRIHTVEAECLHDCFRRSIYE